MVTIWRLEIRLNLDCRRCSLPRDAAGHRIDAATCARIMSNIGMTCANPDEHHRWTL